jgi:hypothetical protein
VRRSRIAIPHWLAAYGGFAITLAISAVTEAGTAAVDARPVAGPERRTTRLTTLTAAASRRMGSADRQA